MRIQGYRAAVLQCNDVLHLKLQKAYGKIVISLSSKLLPALTQFKLDPRRIWTYLNKTYGGRSSVSKYYLLRDVVWATMTEGKIEEQITKFESLNALLIKHETILDDESLAIMLLYSLPPLYSVFATAVKVENMGGKWVYETIKARILAEAQRLKHASTSTSTSSSETALITKTGKSKYYCTHCKKKGHSNKFCWTLHPDKKTTKQKAAVAKKRAYAIVAAATTGNTNRYILDGGVSLHITIHKHHLNNYKDITPFDVMTADDTCQQAIGVEDLTFLMTLDDCAREVTIKNIHYVPKFAHNLLSEPVLLRKGCNISNRGTTKYMSLKNGDAFIKTPLTSSLNFISGEVILNAPFAGIAATTPTLDF